MRASAQLGRRLPVHAGRSRRLLAARASGARSSQPGAGGDSGPTIGDVVELACHDLAYGGQGVCKLDGGGGTGGLTVFVDRALPGERLVAEVTATKKRYAKARRVQVLEPAPDAAEPRCPHFAQGCGGCSLQGLAYDAQLAAKTRQVADLLERVAGLDAGAVAAALRPAVPAGEQHRYGYRNKMEFSFARRAWSPAGGAGRPSAAAGSGCALGLRPQGSATEVLPIAECHLQPAEANAVLQLVAAHCQGPAGRPQGLAAWDQATRTGLLQGLAVRSGTCLATGQRELLVNFLTAADGRRQLAALAARLMAEAPAVVGVVNTVLARGRPAGERAAAALHVLAGRGSLTERLRGLEFEVSPGAFFQTNPRQAEALYGLAEEAAELRPGDTLLDLYCGTGTISLSLAARCAAVWGVERSAAAVADARRNAARNGIAASFIQADLERDPAVLLSQLPHADVVVVDPARAGLSPGVLSYLQRCPRPPRRVVYVSCDPSTQARDLGLLCGTSTARGTTATRATGGAADGAARQLNLYRLAWLAPVDMYPQNSHVETVAALQLVERPD